MRRRPHRLPGMPRILALLAGLLSMAACARPVTTPATAAVPDPPADQSPEAALLTRVSLDTLLAQLPPADTAPACIAHFRRSPNRRVPATPAWLATLRPRVRRVIPTSNCPRSYAPGMIQIVDSLGRPLLEARPPGYVDPYRFLVHPGQVVGDTLEVRIDRWQGSIGTGFFCRWSIGSDGPVACVGRIGMVS
jgi:hypothetical protein